MQIEQRGHLEIHMHFSEPLPEPINIIIIGVTAGSIEIYYDRRVTTHYNFLKIYIQIINVATHIKYDVIENHVGK